jgi:predicted ATPase
MDKYVITGGPCVGKTTLLEGLAARGHGVVREAARDIIAEQNGLGGVLPWTDLGRFQELVLERVIAREDIARGPAFCDRGTLDGIAYCIEGSIPIPLSLVEQGLQGWRSPRYARVFLLDRLPYERDGERREDPTLAQRLHETIGNVYRMSGYDVVPVPVLPPEERVQYVLDRLNVK